MKKDVTDLVLTLFVVTICSAVILLSYHTVEENERSCFLVNEGQYVLTTEPGNAVTGPLTVREEWATYLLHNAEEAVEMEAELRRNNYLRRGYDVIVYNISCP